MRNAPPAREVEAIDPSLFEDDGRLWLVMGGGLIHATELDRQTLMPVSGDWWAPDHTGWHELAIDPGAADDPEWVEAARLHRSGAWEKAGSPLFRRAFAGRSS